MLGRSRQLFFFFFSFSQLETETLWKGRAEPEAVKFGGGGEAGWEEGDSLELWWWEGFLAGVVELSLEALIFGVRLWLRI